MTIWGKFSRESPVIYLDKSIRSEQAFVAMEKVKVACGLPIRIKVGNEPEFISRVLDVWAYFNKVKLDYSQAGTPTDNMHIESFDLQPSIVVSGTNA